MGVGKNPATIENPARLRGYAGANMFWAPIFLPKKTSDKE